jgi:hypothetical protein
VPSDTRRWPDLAGPSRTRAGEALGHARQERHSGFARDRFASRLTCKLPAMGKLLGKDQSSGIVAHHLDELPDP